MSEPKSISAIIHISGKYFLEYLRSGNASAFVNEMRNIIKNGNKDFIVFRYIKEDGVFFYYQWIDYISDKEMEDSPEVKALQALNNYKKTRETDYIVLSPSAPNFLEDEPSCIFSMVPGKVEKTENIPKQVMNMFAKYIEKYFFAVVNEKPAFDEDWLKDERLIEPKLNKQYLAFSKKQNNIKAIQKATPENPAHLFGFYYFDGKNVFDQIASVNVGIPKILENADPFTLRQVGPQRDHFVADNKNAYYLNKKILGADGLTFRRISKDADGGFFADKNHAYYDGGEIIKDADPAAFVDLDYGFAKDFNGFYSGNKKIGKFMEPFTINKCGFLITKEFIYHYDFKIDLDPTTFEIIDYDKHIKRTNPFIGPYYLKDKNGLYFYNDSRSNRYLEKVKKIEPIKNQL
ncbi:hypothetical protein A3J90_03980 [candidate division WOR-1 bacterium RIFOXYC2_FULL_37_10]|uniref:DKNYY family protein n=1 Tax=candidate division WOR-1 bacterium RIFOXYB2_FULL_37_13 TaxID=1802579 RepID=A0A1F4SHC8_UNCSA|nr:MAG: hypothetical protein A2310_05725 [candidate division WOR-1 bacterium RIFOXYB2_FULL_37_13]OGC32928.1 MAG: hypothetical protein A3J90_03980 [candidate division WOR-1 bacterium RIFOXYC2_FULL_37_10]